MGKNFSGANRGQRKKSDFYETPYSMTRRFLDEYTFTNEILETEEEVKLILESRHFDVRIIGEDYKDKDFTGKDICEQRGIRICYNSRQHHLSSSELRKRIKDK